MVKLSPYGKEVNKMTFVKINRTNTKGELKETLINAECIVSVKERTLEPTKLYNEEGELVEERANDTKEYILALNDGKKYHLDETNYNTLVAALVK